MKKLFNLGLYIQGLKRVRAAGTAIAVSTGALELIGAINISSYPDLYSSTVLGSEEFMLGALVLLLLAPVLSYLMFSFLNKRQSADFYHAMPHKRITVYISNILALYTWLFGILIVNWCISAFAFIAVGGFEIPFDVLFGNPAFFACSILAVSGATVLAVMCTGTAISATYTAGMLIFLPVWFMSLTESLLSFFYPALDTEHGLIKYISTRNSIFVSVWDGESFNASSGSVAVLGLFWLVLAGVGYVKRKSETAGNASAGGAFKAFIRCILPFLFLLGGIRDYIVYKETDGLVTFVIMAAAAMFVYELLVTKQVKCALKAMPWLLAVAALCGAVTGTAYLCGKAMKNNDPTSVSQVESVSILDRYSFSSGVYISTAIHDIKDGEVIEWLVDSLNRQTTVPNGWEDTHIMIKLKNGKKLWRCVELYSSGEGALRDYVQSTPELNKIVVPLVEPASFNSEKHKELWEIYREEYYALPIYERAALDENHPGGALTFSVGNAEKNGLIYAVTATATKKQTPKSYKYALENGIYTEWTGEK